VWQNPGFITTPGTPYATVTMNKTGRYSNYLQATDYGFNIPAEATIDGIMVVINRQSDFHNPSLLDNVVSLVKAGAITGDNKATLIVWPTTMGTAVYGGATDLWGTTWTSADVNADNFGVVLATYRQNNGNNDRTASVDFMQVSVYYTFNTTTEVACGDGTPITYGDSLICVATVTDITGATTPTGTVAWTMDGSGAFVPNPCTLSGADTVATCSATYTPSEVGDGSHLVTATYSGDAFHTSSHTSQTVTVNTRPVTVTADPQTKVYGDPDPALTYQVTSGSLVFSDTFTGTLTRDPGEDAGTYTILQGSLVLSDNYDLTYVENYLTIGLHSITVTADAQSKVYGDVDPLLTYQITTGELLPGDSFSGALDRVPGEDAGTYAITQGNLSLPEYYALSFISDDLTITPRQVEVTADAKTKQYGNPDPELTYLVTSGSLVPGDDFTGELERETGEEVGTYAILQGSLALSDNYDLSFVSDDLTITLRVITVVADAKSKDYGQPDPGLTYHITVGSLLSGDAFSGTIVRQLGERIGTYPIHQGTLSLPNYYDLTFVGSTLTINGFELLFPMMYNIP
jgi:hypothetical protein